MDVYEPREDSALLAAFIARYARGRVLDVGTGSGIQALHAARSPQVREVVGVDINPNAVERLRQAAREAGLRNVQALEGDMFSCVSGQFDTIVCNPPYLPQDEGIEDAALYGGKEGWEWSERFFDQLSSYLTSRGVCLYLFSSLTNKEKIEELLSRRLFSFEQLGEESHFFEKLYVYKIVKSDMLRDLEGQGLSQVRYFSQGERGFIYRALYDESSREKKFLRSSAHVPVAIKMKNPESAAQGRIDLEARMLREVNKHGLGPRLLFSREGYFVYRFVEGEAFHHWFEGTVSPIRLRRVLLLLLRQARSLDLLGISKEEMHKPFSNVLITALDEPILLDFERAHRTDKPSNVTQFTEFLARFSSLFSSKGVELLDEQLRHAAQAYKSDYSQEHYLIIEKLLDA